VLWYRAANQQLMSRGSARPGRGIDQLTPSPENVELRSEIAYGTYVGQVQVSK